MKDALRRVIAAARRAVARYKRWVKEAPIDAIGTGVMALVAGYLIVAAAFDFVDWIGAPPPEAKPAPAAKLEKIGAPEMLVLLSPEKKGLVRRMTVVSNPVAVGVSLLRGALVEVEEGDAKLALGDLDALDEMKKAARSGGVPVDFTEQLPERFGGPSEKPASEHSLRLFRALGVMMTVFGYLLPILFIYFLIWQMRMMAGMKRRKSGAATAESKIRFADVAGCHEAKVELAEAVEFLRTPYKFAALGAEVPRGVLLAGPPGNGKTLLARAVAGEADCDFIQASGAEFEDMFVGVGATRVRELFAKARMRAPCIVFIDEIDAIGGKRRGGATSWETQTINQLLCEMDGFDRNAAVVVIAATNLAENLDPALVRAGRFSRHVAVAPPDALARRELLEIHSRSKPIAADADLNSLARATAGFSGADLANLCNEAAIRAVRGGRTEISTVDFDAARDRIVMGSATGIRPDAEDLKVVAHHEAGHALVAVLTPESDPVSRATITPRGGALGMVVRLPESDRLIVRRSKLLADLRVAMAGRAAEERLLGTFDISTGAAGDIRAAVEIARRMVMEWGMGSGFSSILAMSAPGASTASQGISESQRKEVDVLVEAALDEARELIAFNGAALDRIAAALLDRETLSGEEIRGLISNAGDDLAACEAHPGERDVRANGVEAERQPAGRGGSGAESEEEAEGISCRLVALGV